MTHGRQPPPVPLARDEELTFSKEPHHATLAYERAAPLFAHLEALGEMYLEDKRVERKRGWLIAGFLFLGIPGMLLARTTVGASLIPIAVLLYWYQALAKLDLENRRLHAARFVLESLTPAIPAERPFELRLDFKGFHKTPPRFDVGSGSGAPRYELEWLRMELPLLDGSRVQLSVRTHLERVEHRRRKYTEVREELSDELEIEIRRPSEALSEPSELSELSTDALRARLAEHPTLRLEDCRVGPGYARFTFRTPTAGRMRLRHGWSAEGLEALLEGHKLLERIRACHEAVTRETLLLDTAPPLGPVPS